jgi:hypothetical protein
MSKVFEVVIQAKVQIQGDCPTDGFQEVNDILEKIQEIGEAEVVSINEIPPMVR